MPVPIATASREANAVKRRIDERLNAPFGSNRSRAFLQRLRGDQSWIKKAPKTQASKAKIIDLALLAFTTAEAQRLKFPEHMPQSKIGRQQAVEIAKANDGISLDVGSIATLGAQFKLALQEDPSLRHLWTIREFALDDFGRMVEQVIAWLNGLGMEGQSLAHGLGLGAPQTLKDEAARKSYFERKLSDLFQRQFDRPCDELVAELSRIAFPAKTDGITSPGTLKQRRHRLRKKSGGR